MIAPQVDDSLAGVVATADHVPGPEGSAGPPPNVKLAELNVEMTYMRRDVDRITGSLDKIGSLAERVGSIEASLKHLPTHREMLGYVAVALAIIAALSVFGQDIRAAFGR